jgi:group I intron endonuclease
MYHIYKITNQINGKNYIGFTKKKRPADRWSEHKSTVKNQNILKQNLHKAMRKHGTENFVFEVIYSHEDKDHVLKEMEDKFITEYNSMGPHGYNMTRGGGGQVSPSAKTRKKMSESMKGRVPWNKDKTGAQTAWNKGLTIDDPRVARNVEASHKKRREDNNYTPWNKGLKITS